MVVVSCAIEMRLVHEFTTSREIEQSLRRVSFFRRANAWVKLPEADLLRLELERGDFWWVLIRDQSEFRDAFLFRHSVVRPLLTSASRVKRTFRGRFIDIGWNISIKQSGSRFFLVVHGNARDKVEITQFRNDRTAATMLLQDAGAVTRAIEIATRIQEIGAGANFNDVDLDKRIRKTIQVIQRPGQAKFRRDLLKAYSWRCAITKCDVSEALQAAHIFPYRGYHTDVPCNGLIMRADLHSLFDAGLLAIRPTDFRVVIASRLHQSQYADLQNNFLHLPSSHEHQPSARALSLHFSVFSEF